MKKFYSLLLLIFFVGQKSDCQIPNSNFENWSLNTYSILEPTDWVSYNFGASTASQYSPAQNGTYAVKLTNDTSQGFMLPGSIECTFPYSARPASLDGFYLAQFAPQDILIASIYLYNSQGAVAGGSVDISANAGAYTAFSVPIVYVSANNPDSALITFYLQPNSNTELSGYAVVDNISLNGTIGTNDIENAFELNLWPNPVSQYLNISITNLKSKNASIGIFDLNGRIVSAFESNDIYSSVEKNIQIPVDRLSNGMYFLKISEEGKSVTRTFVMQR